MHRWHSFVILSGGRDENKIVGPIKNSIVFCYRHILFAFFWRFLLMFSGATQNLLVNRAFFLHSFVRPFVIFAMHTYNFFARFFFILFPLLVQAHLFETTNTIDFFFNTEPDHLSFIKANMSVYCVPCTVHRAMCMDFRWAFEQIRIFLWPHISQTNYSQI